jgi:hypothetical protein
MRSVDLTASENRAQSNISVTKNVVALRVGWKLQHAVESVVDFLSFRCSFKNDIGWLKDTSEKYLIVLPNFRIYVNTARFPHPTTDIVVHTQAPTDYVIQLISYRAFLLLCATITDHHLV